MNGRSFLSGYKLALNLSTKRQSSSSLPQLASIKVGEERKGVYHVELNRPKSRNSLTIDVWKELKVAFDYLARHPPCRSIVLSGSGQSFCAGIDLKEGITTLLKISADPSIDVSRKAYLINDSILLCQEGFNALEQCKKPVIAAIQGHCVGAGISLVSCADIRYSVTDAVFSIKEPDVGLAADVGILQRLQKVSGNESWAREAAFTARTFSGDEALKYGFVSRTFDSKDLCLSSAFELAAEIAQKTPVAVYGTKLAMNYARDHSISDSLEWIRNWNQAHLQSGDMQKIAEADRKSVV